MAEKPTEQDPVQGENPPIKSGGGRAGFALHTCCGGLEEPAAEHGCQCEGDHSGDQDRCPNGDCELPEEPSHDSSHKKDRNEDGCKREGHGDNGEADLPGAFQGRLKDPSSHFRMADDVLHHDDGIVHHETNGENKGHKGEVVEAVAQDIHDGEGPYDGHGHGQAGYEGKGESAKEEKDDQHHQKEGKEQGELDVGHGILHTFRTVIENAK